MLYWWLLVLVFLILNYFHYGLSTHDMEFGVAQAEKAAKGVCWIEKFNDGAASYENCKENSDFIKTFQWLRDEYRKDWNGPEATPPKEEEDETLTDWMKNELEGKITAAFPKYSSCLQATKDINGKPTSDYRWLLGDSEENEYPYKEFANCLLAVAEDLNGRQLLDDLKTKWENGPIFFSDIEKGLSQAEKVVRAVCWNDYVRKNYDGSKHYYCKRNVDYVEMFKSYVDEYNTETAEEGKTPATNAENTDLPGKVQDLLEDRMKDHLSDYESCLPFTRDMEAKPAKDYGELLGDSEGTQYPYIAFTYCLLEVVKTNNGESALEDLKTKWGRSSVFSVTDIENGLTWVEKAAKQVCMDESKLGLGVDCNDEDIDFIKTFKSYVDDYNNEIAESGAVAAANVEDTLLPDSVQSFLGDRIDSYFPSYSSCLPLAQNMEAQPSKEYGSLLEDSDGGEYLYRGFAHCLLEVLEERKKNNPAADLVKHEETPQISEDILKTANESMSNVPMQTATIEDVEVVQNSDEPLANIPIKGMTIKDVEYGIAKAKQVAAVACWIETIHKCRQNNSGNYPFKNCLMAHNYVQDLEQFRKRDRLRWAEQAHTREERVDTYVASFSIAIEIAMIRYLSGYKACQLYLEDTDDAPNKDYGWFFGEDERSEYPYKAYTHCLLEATEFYYGKKSLDKLKWETLKTQNSFEGYNNPVCEEVEENCETWREFKLPGMTSIDALFGDLDNGIIQAEKVIKGVCLAEILNNPFTECRIRNKFYPKFVTHRWQMRKRLDTEENAAEDKATLIGIMHSIIQRSLTRQLPGFNNSCFQYTQDVNKIAPKDYWWVLGDDENSNYPYRGFTNCLVEVFENRNGKKALDDLKSKLNGSKTLQENMLEAENRNRARHGVPPMGLDDELTIRAQRWADYLANEKCELVHMMYEKPGHPDLMFNDMRCGENLGRFGNLYADDDAIGLECAALFYQEIEFYPWPAFTEKDGVELYLKIGHFTQSVWKETSLAGYAISIGKCNAAFIVARYWPLGNRRHAFEENVLPLID